MEGSLPHSRRALRTYSYVLRINQLSSHLPNDDEYELPPRNRSGVAVGIHGRPGHPYQTKAGRNRRTTSTETSKICPPYPRHVTETRPLPQTREVRLQTRRDRLPRGHCRQRQTRNGPPETERRRRLADA